MSIKPIKLRAIALLLGSIFFATFITEWLSKDILTADASILSLETTTTAESAAAKIDLNIQPLPPASDGFDFPVGTYGPYNLCPDNKGALSCYWLCRGFQDIVNNACQKTGYGDHLGEDWNRGSLSAPDDFGDPVYAVANGEVIFAQSDVPIAGTTKNWGKVIIVRHTLPDGTQVESQYGHLEDMLVAPGDLVVRGQQIATIGDGDGRWNSHLHFEIRYSNCPYWGTAGPAWSTIATGWANPSNFINSHRTLNCGFAVGDGVSGSELSGFAGANSSAGGQAFLGCPTASVDTNGFTSLNGTIGHRQVFAAGEVQFLTNGNNAGQAFAVLAPLDAKWRSLGVDNNNPLGYASGNRTPLLTTCFGTRRVSQPFEGGSLEYHLTGQRAENVYAVHGPIHTKWSQKGFAACPLGMPISDVRSAPASGATGNVGFMSDFEGGHIYLLANNPEAFAVHGAIDSLYTQMGGSAGWLGYPTSDQYVDQYPRVDFEAGYITTTDGTNYRAFPADAQQAGADLSVTMGDSPDPVPLDSNLTYSIVVANNGSNSATGVTLTDVLPSNVTFVSLTPSQGTCTGSTSIGCNLGNLANGASALLTLVVKTKSLGTVTNTVTVRALEYDDGALTATPTGNNRVTQTTVVNPKADLTITKTASTGVVLIGQNITYSVVAKNLGPSPATGVSVIDPLPASMTFVSASSTVGNCSEGNGTVTCSVGNLAKSASATITIVGTTTVGGTISNSASVSGNEADIVTSNNMATKTVTVRTISSVSFTPSTVAGCSNSIGKVTLTGAAPAGGAMVSLSSDNPLVSVPPTILVPEQATYANFTATTAAVATSQPVTITATLGPALKSAILTLRPIGVQSLTLSPNPVSSGTSVTGTVQLECTATLGAITVTLSSTNKSAAQVPSNVTIPAGASSQTFLITTGNVTSTTTSTIKATANGISKSVVLQVQP